MKSAPPLLVFVLLLTGSGSGLDAEERALRGFSARSAARQLRLEAEIRRSLSADRVERHLRWLTSRSHPPGSEGARLTAEYLHRELASYGLRAETVRYQGYLPAPVAVSVELLEPVAESLATFEDPIAADPFTQDAEQHPGWSGYSPSGEAVGEVVYGHFGSEEDLQRLAASGIDLNGKILLLRNFGTGEGRKVRNAERFGAAGVLLYTDPAEDGYRFGDVYPRGNWRPPSSIMRRSILFLPYEGDPRSPGWASVPGAERLPLEELALPRIPVLPISYGTAERILSLTRGPVASPAWQGALPVTYRLGPGPARIRLRTEMDNRDRPMLDVLGWLEGEIEPHQWVIVGNHHDAWIYGAGDPSSGTAALLELARVLGERSARGERPRRTIVIAFWDAEEMALGGSTEWVEDHADELLDKAVACINMDSAVFNPERPLSVAAHPVLHELFRSVARAVLDPRTGSSTFEVWRDLQNSYREVPSVDGWGEFFDPRTELAEPWIFGIPYDDAAPFFTLLALPSSDMYYGADYGMYHSLYESFHWMVTVVDPGFAYHLVMAQLQGFVALRLANAELVPLDFAEEARWWRRAYRQLEEVARHRAQQVPHLEEALVAIDRWEAAAEALAAETAELLADARHLDSADSDLAAVNRSLYLMARDFLRSEGHPGMPLDRNLFAGSSHDLEGTSGSTLPGLRFSLDRHDLPTAESEARLYLAALERRNQNLRSIRRRLQELP